MCLHMCRQHMWSAIGAFRYAVRKLLHHYLWQSWKATPVLFFVHVSCIHTLVFVRVFHRGALDSWAISDVYRVYNSFFIYNSIICPPADPSACLSHNCQNGAVCVHLGPGSYRCECTPGWTGPLCGIGKLRETNRAMDWQTCPLHHRMYEAQHCTLNRHRASSVVERLRRLH